MTQLTPNGRIFILGAPRSGTTFLASLLRKTRYGSPFETHFITKYFKRLDRYGDLSDRDNFIKLANDLLSERPVMQWRLDTSAEELFRQLAPIPSLGTLTDQLLLMARREKNSQSVAWGDKTPHYLADWPILLKLFPDAKFILIVRDGRDVALSLLQKTWGPSTTIECARYWEKLNREKAALEKQLNPKHLYSLSYEQLIKSPQEHVLKLYEFLNEPMPVDEVDGLTASTKQQNSGKWRTSMSPRQKRQFEAVAGQQLRALGYPLSCNDARLYPGELTLNRVLEAVNRLKFLFHANVVDGFKIRFLGKEPFAE
jgi:hypothetical protein